MEALLGGLFGGLLRLAPEFLKWMDRKDERAHELSMQDKQLEFERVRGSQKMDEMGVEAQSTFDASALLALTESIKGQSVVSGIKWVDALSISVRPIITYCFFGLYMAVKITALAYMYQETGWKEAINSVWTGEDIGLWAGILNFWFLGRVFEKVSR